MWLVADFDSSIRTCGCKDNFHVCVLVFFGRSCSLSALTGSPSLGQSSTPVKEQSPLRLWSRRCPPAVAPPPLPPLGGTREGKTCRQPSSQSYCSSMSH